MTAQESDDGHAATAAAASAQQVQGQFVDAEQDGRGRAGDGGRGPLTKAQKSRFQRERKREAGAARKNNDDKKKK